MKCPYCNSDLKALSANKPVCPDCSNSIYSRTLPMSKDILLLKKDGALLFDSLDAFGITSSDYPRIEKIAHGDCSFIEGVWDLLDNTKRKAIKQKYWFTSFNIAWQQSWYNFITGNEFFSLRQEAERQYLQYFKESGISKVKIIVTGDDNVCAKCASLNGKILTVDEALEKMPIPNKKTGHKCWCRCSYIRLTE